jgi:hypothetical protein
MRVEGGALASFMHLQFRQPEICSPLIKVSSVTLDIIGLVSPAGIQSVIMGAVSHRMGAECHQQKELGLSSAGFSR